MCAAPMALVTVVETHKGGDGGATGMTFTSVQQVQLLHSSFGVCNTCAAAAENKEEKKKKKSPGISVFHFTVGPTLLKENCILYPPRINIYKHKCTLINS